MSGLKIKGYLTIEGTIIERWPPDKVAALADAYKKTKPTVKEIKKQFGLPDDLILKRHLPVIALENACPNCGGVLYFEMRGKYWRRQASPTFVRCLSCEHVALYEPDGKQRFRYCRCDKCRAIGRGN